MEKTKKIVEMLVEKKVSADEALELLQAVKEKESRPKNKHRFLKILVTSDKKNRPLVNVTIPLLLIKLGMKFVPNDQGLKANINDTKLDLSGLDWDEIIKAAILGDVGDLFTAEIEEKDESITKVRIYVE